MKNSFGHLIRMHTFGESHGPAMGVVLDGLPAGIPYNHEMLLADLARRRPGHWSSISAVTSTKRKEEDYPEILSGIYENKTLGTPICIIIRNQDAKSQDYHNLSPRVGHADQAWINKFNHTDPRGGGRSSGRETVSRVIAGSFAKMLLTSIYPNLKITAFTSQIGPFQLTRDESKKALTQPIDNFIGRFPSENQQEAVKDLLLEAQSSGDSWGGIATLIIEHPPIGLGQPVFHKLKSDLAQAFMSIGATSQCAMDEFQNFNLPGSQFHHQNQSYGGLNGGISNGQNIIFQIGFKPTSSILNVAKNGRHDPCIIPRAVPVLEAMANWVITDHILWSRHDRMDLL